MWLKIFSYGSNLCSRRMRERAPSLRIVDVAQLAGQELRFHKRGLDGSGKADAFHTGRPDHAVWGVVAEIQQHDLAALDQAESLGVGYQRQSVAVVQRDGRSREVLIYFALPTMIDPRLKPFDWYLDFVLYGAREHALPDDYVLRLQSTAVETDPDSERSRRNRRLLDDCR